MAHEQDYIAHINEITEKCKAAGIDDWDMAAIVDRGVNEQDAHHNFGTDAYWKTMIYSATFLAASWFEERGQNLNDVMGRLVY